jgi:glycosyltransferase involved in cell wall biosynthesis
VESDATLISTNRIFLVGPRYRHHSGHSGYENFQRYVGTALESPISGRFLARTLGVYPLIGDFGWRLDQLAAAFTTRTLYSFKILLLEAGVALHMAGRRGAVYHVLYGDSDVLLTAHAARWTGNAVCATFHDPPRVLAWLKVQRIASQLDGVICLCEEQRRFFDGLVAPHRLFTIPHGVDTNFFRPALGAPVGPVLITVGSKLRDFRLLTAALQLIWRERPDVRLLAVGTRRQGDENPHLDATDPRITALDGIDDSELLAAYHTATVALFPLSDATANNSLLEAMACGLPIVATDVGGVREYVGEGPALLCGAGEPQEFANAVLRVLSEPALSRRMSVASRERSAHFDYRRVAQQMRSVYQTIAEANGRRAKVSGPRFMTSEGGSRPVSGE